MLNFPDPGDTIEIQLFDPPVKNGESKSEFEVKKKEFAENRGLVKLKIKLIGRTKYINASYAIRNIQADETRRIYERRREDPEKLDEELHSEDFFSEEYVQATDAWARSVLIGTLEAVAGFKVGGKPVEKIDDGEKLIEVLSFAGWLEQAAGRALARQAPGVAERFL